MQWMTLAFGILVLSIVAVADLGVARPVFDAIGTIPGGDKICHFLLVGGLCGLVCLTLASRQPRQAVRVILVTVAVFLVLATAEELSQQWLVERTFSLADMACNDAGILTFGYLALRSHRKTLSA